MAPLPASDSSTAGATVPGSASRRASPVSVRSAWVGEARGGPSGPASRSIPSSLATWTSVHTCWVTRSARYVPRSTRPSLPACSVRRRSVVWRRWRALRTLGEARWMLPWATRRWTTSMRRRRSGRAAGVFPMCWSAGCPTTPGDPPSSGRQWRRRGRGQGRPCAWAPGTGLAASGRWCIRGSAPM
jgi:hypothetical protein